MTDQQIINLFFEELIEEICKEENSSSFDRDWETGGPARIRT